MHRVLVVGERPEEAKALAFRLGLAGYESAPSASEMMLALRALFALQPDAIVLDVGSNGGGRELFQLLERVSQLPILVLGDGRSGDDLVWYLESGAADYLAKPVSPAILSPRIGTILRRRAQQALGGAIRVGSLEMDLDRYQVRKNEVVISLTPTEFRLLQVLAENAGKACSRRMLLERVWGEDFRLCSHYLRLYIGYLRQKLEDDPGSPRLLVTEWGVGYRLIAEQASSGSSGLRRIRAALT